MHEPGYVPQWILLLEAVALVQEIAGLTFDEALDNLRIALREKAVESRVWGARYPALWGRDKGIAAVKWYDAAVDPETGFVRFRDGYGLRGQPIKVEVRRRDVVSRFRQEPGATSADCDGSSCPDRPLQQVNVSITANLAHLPNAGQIGRETRRSSAKADSGTPRPKARDADVREWYQEHIRQCQASGNQTSEDDDWKAAREKFGDRVRRNQIRDLRRELAPRKWRSQGRRKNSAKNPAE